MYLKLIVFYSLSRSISIFSMLVLPLWFSTSHSDIQYSTYVMMEYIPFIILGLVSGHYIDNYDLKKITAKLLFIQFLASLLFTLALFYNGGAYIYISIFILSACSYTIWGIVNKLSHTSLKRDDYNKFNSLVDMSEKLLEVILPIILGFILSYNIILFVVVYIVISTACLLSFISINKLGHAYQFDSKNHNNNDKILLMSLKNGISSFFSNKSLLLLSVLVMLINAIEIMPLVVMPIYAKNYFSLDSVELSSIYTLGAIGAIVGGILAYKLLKNKILIFFGLVVAIPINAVIYFLIYTFDSISLLFFAFFIESMFVSLSAIAFRTLRQHYINGSDFGVMTGISGSMIKVMIPCAILLSGFISEYYGARSVYFICGVMELIALIPFIAFARGEIQLKMVNNL